MPQWEPVKHESLDYEGTATNPISIDDVSLSPTARVCKPRATFSCIPNLNSTLNLEAGHHRMSTSRSTTLDREATERELTPGRITETPPINSKRKAELQIVVGGEEKQLKVSKGEDTMPLAPATKVKSLSDNWTGKEKVIYRPIAPELNAWQTGGKETILHTVKTNGKKYSTTDVEASLSTVIRQKFHLN